MAGTIPLSLTQQLDKFGQPLAGGKLYLYQAGTVATPQNGYQDSALTLPWPNPIVLDAAGRLPQFFLADGSIKVRLVDVDGNQQFAQDGLIVTGASSGGGGGSPVDPTTLLQTGWMQPIYGTGVVGGFVRANGRTIGSSTSSATERANSDTQALFTFLWNADPNLAVSGGRGVSAAADWSANNNIALPDFRGRALAGLDDMGNSAAGRLTATYFGTAATALGAAGGSESNAIILNHAHTGTTGAMNSNASHTHTSNANSGSTTTGGGGFGAGSNVAATINAANIDHTHNFTTANAGSAAAHNIAQPTMLATIYIKL